MKDPRVRRAVIIGSVTGCALLSLFLVMLAIDVVRSHEALASGDDTYTSSPKEGGLWKPGALGASTLTHKVLGVDDDLAFREAVRALRLSQQRRADGLGPRRDPPACKGAEAIAAGVERAIPTRGVARGL